MELSEFDKPLTSATALWFDAQVSRSSDAWLLSSAVSAVSADSEEESHAPLDGFALCSSFVSLMLDACYLYFLSSLFLQLFAARLFDEISESHLMLGSQLGLGLEQCEQYRLNRLHMI